MSAFFRLNRRHWHQHMVDGLRPHEFSILISIHRLTTENAAGPRLSDLSGMLGVTPPTVTQQVSELERRGLLERRRNDADRRTVRVVLSPMGTELLERHRAGVLSLFSSVSEHLGPERSETLASLLSDAADYLEGVK